MQVATARVAAGAGRARTVQLKLHTQAHAFGFDNDRARREVDHLNTFGRDGALRDHVPRLLGTKWLDARHAAAACRGAGLRKAPPPIDGHALLLEFAGDAGLTLAQHLSEVRACTLCARRCDGHAPCVCSACCVLSAARGKRARRLSACRSSTKAPGTLDHISTAYTWLRCRPNMRHSLTPALRPSCHSLG